jgi:site-specific DNA recombinase
VLQVRNGAQLLGEARRQAVPYYVCLAAQKKGWHTCPSKSAPAGEMERFVVEQIQRVGSDPAVLEGTLRKVRQQQDKALADLRAEQRANEREMARRHLALRKLAAAPNADRLAEVNEAILAAERKATELRERATTREQEHVDPAAVRIALSSLAPVWGQLAPKEQAPVIQLLVERVDYDGKAGTISVTFHPSGIKALATEQVHEVAA